MTLTTSMSPFIMHDVKRVEIVRSVFTIAVLVVAVSFHIGCKSSPPQNTNSASSNANSSSAPPASVRCTEVCPNRVLVAFTERLSPAEIKRIEAMIEEDMNKTVDVREVGGLNVLMISAPGLTVQQIQDLFVRKNELVKTQYIEPDFQLGINGAPTDPLFTNQWALNNTGQSLGVCGGTEPQSQPSPAITGADIHALEAWGQLRSDRQTVVAVIDTGVNYNHNDLDGVMWSSPLAFDLTIGGQQVTCSVSTHGFDAITNTCDPMDDGNGHGTHVAGIIGAETNSLGVVGVTPLVSIIAVRAFGTGGGCSSQVANGIDFLVQIKQRPALNANIVIVNNSYGFMGQVDENCVPQENCTSRTLRAAVRRAGEHGMLFVASAGNDEKDTRCYPVYPASFDLPNIISVAASDNRDELGAFSNFGKTSVHLAAPGVQICSTVNNANLYGYKNGTSMAAPFVSGSAALVWSRCGLPTEALKQVLLDSVDHPMGLQDKTITGGRLNLARAIKICGGQVTE